MSAYEKNEEKRRGRIEEEWNRDRKIYVTWDREKEEDRKNMLK